MRSIQRLRQCILWSPSKTARGAISKTAPVQSELLIEPLNSSRGASRTGGNENKGAIKNYAWQGQVIRLSQAQLDKWRASYPCLPDLEAVLQKADDYYADNPPPNGKWFFRVSRWLEEENAKHAEKRRAAERQITHGDRRIAAARHLGTAEAGRAEDAVPPVQLVPAEKANSMFIGEGRK